MPTLISFAHSQETQKGIAFVEAPEQGGGVCLDASPEKAFECAVAKCTQSGALDEDCIRVKWCFPAGWSADVFKQHNEGPHWHDALCGWQSEVDLDAAIKIVCEGSAKAYLIECSVVTIWKPDGTKIELIE